MKYGFFRCNVFVLFLLTGALPFRVDGASAPSRIVVTFGGLSERGGVPFVAQDAGFFQKHGLDASLGEIAAREAPLDTGKVEDHYRQALDWLKHSECVRSARIATVVWANCTGG